MLHLSEIVFTVVGKFWTNIHNMKISIGEINRGWGNINGQNLFNFFIKLGGCFKERSDSTPVPHEPFVIVLPWHC